MRGKDTQARRIVLGSGRSGTTWVLDSLATANHLRPVFEPLHPVQSAIGARHAYRAMAPGDGDEELERYFRDLAAGHVHSLWIDYRGRKERLFPSPVQLTRIRGWRALATAWRRHLALRATLRGPVRRQSPLIKCIRANLMAGWLTRTLGFRTVLIVRHPCAAVESQYRLGGVFWDPAPVIARYRANHRLHEITGGRYLDLLHRELTPLEALTLNWVIENQWPAERSLEDGYTVAYYEDLVESPGSSWRQVCEALALPALPNPDSLQHPSQQASAASLERPAWRQRQPRWQQNLTTGQLNEIQGVLDATGCALYRVSDPLPLRQSDEQAAHA